jgi:heterodisulfide reductase subunit A
VSAVKQAIELREHYPSSDVICLYMDLRMYDNGFEELYREAQVKHGVKFIRGRLSECSQSIDKQLVLKIQDTLAGLPMRITVDQLVLMVGKEAAPLPVCPQSVEIKRASHHFIEPCDVHLRSNETSQPGIFCCGTSTGPKTIQESTTDAKSAALSIIDYLNRK